MFYTATVSNVVTFEMTRYRGNAPKQDNNRQTKQKKKRIRNTLDKDSKKQVG